MNEWWIDRGATCRDRPTDKTPHTPPPKTQTHPPDVLQPLLLKRRQARLPAAYALERRLGLDCVLPALLLPVPVLVRADLLLLLLALALALLLLHMCAV